MIKIIIIPFTILIILLVFYIPLSSIYEGIWNDIQNGLTKLRPELSRRFVIYSYDCIKQNNKLKLTDDLYIKFNRRLNSFSEGEGTYLLVDKDDRCLYKITDNYVLSKYDFLQLGPNGRKLWNLFKAACIKEINRVDSENKHKDELIKLERQRIDEEVAKKLNSQVMLPNGWSKVCQKSDSETNKIDPYLLEQLERFIQHSYCPIACKNTVRDLIDLFRQLKDSRWIQRCNSYYIPEILELLSEISKDTTKVFELECEETISRFEKQLRSIIKNSDLKQKSQEQRVMLSTFQAMMEMDGLIPDMIQEKSNKQRM